MCDRGGIHRSAAWLPVALLLLVACGDPVDIRDVSGDGAPLLIVHAGGRYEGLLYTNSLEAMDASYARGYRVFEVDMLETPDGGIVLLHDWEQTFEELFPAQDLPATAAEFQALPMRGNMTPMVLEDLLAWLAANEDAVIVTDVKGDNPAVLERVARAAGPLRTRIQPQIYRPSEFEPVAALGFGDALLTLYAAQLTPAEVIEFATSHDLFAVVMPVDQASREDLAATLMERGVVVYSHTINDLDEWRDLRAKGVHGIYTDDVAPRDIPVDLR